MTKCFTNACKEEKKKDCVIQDPICYLKDNFSVNLKLNLQHQKKNVQNTYHRTAFGKTGHNLQTNSWMTHFEKVNARLEIAKNYTFPTISVKEKFLSAKNIVCRDSVTLMEKIIFSVTYNFFLRCFIKTFTWFMEDLKF